MNSRDSIGGSYKVIDKAAYFRKIGYEPHPGQLRFHNAGTRFRIPVCGRRYGKSWMAGRDREPSLLVPNTRGWIIGPCVDELTEIFTSRGWLRYDEVVEGDKTLSINPSTGLGEWDTVHKVLRYPGQHRVVHMTTQSFDAVSTGHHRWLSHSTNRQGPESGWVWRTTDTLRPTDRIPRAVPVADLPAEAKHTDNLVETLAWLWTEGSVVNGKDFRISQSLTANPDNVLRIRRAVQGLCRNETVTHDGTMAQFYFNGELLWPHLLRHKVVRPEFILELTPAQLRLFIDVSVLGDGRGNCIYQNSEEQLFAVQLAATLLGISTSTKRRGDGQYVLSLLTKTYAAVRSMETQEEVYEGEVWCVTTQNHNWLARRHGSVYYTGNTYDLGEKEFRVIWMDMMVKLKLGRDRRIHKAYNKKQGQMYIEFPWGTVVEVRSADHAESLVGDSLDWVIMSEAAKHKLDTWERYVRAALADKRGTADFPTCVTGDSLVITDNGIVRIDELALGDVGEYTPIKLKVAGLPIANEDSIHAFNNGPSGTYKVTLVGGYHVEGTPNHPVWTRSGWKELQNLNIWDEVAVRMGAELWGHEHLEPDDAYLMGLIHGDGHVFMNSNVACVTVASADLEVQALLEARGFRLQPNSRSPNGSTIAYRLNSRSYVRHLLDWGFELTTSKFKKIPARILRADRETVCAYLSGLCDADGTANIRGRVSLASTCFETIRQVQVILANMGIASSWSTKLTPPTRLCKVESRMWNLEIYDERFYTEIGFRIARKQAKGNKSWNQKRREPLKWCKVKDISKGFAYTYDLVVPTSHALTTNAVVSHNTPEGQNWLYELWLLGQDPRYPDYWSQQFPSWLNPYVYPGGRDDPEIKLIEATTAGEWFLQEYGADFTSFVGRIYPDWQVKTHVREVKFNPAWPNYICVDEETEILTKRGWLRHNEVTTSDETLTVNPSTGLGEWNCIENVRRYPDGPHKVVRMEGRQFSALTTPDHNWLTWRDPHPRGGKSGWQFRTTQQLAQADCIPKAVPMTTLPTEQKYVDALVEVLAWLWTEGSVGRNNTFTIHQSHTANPSKVSQIRIALTTLFPEGIWSEKIRPSAPNMTAFYLGASNSRILWEMLNAHKVIKPEFIMQLTKAQLQLFVETSIAGDGHVDKTSGRRSIQQENLEQLFAVQLACHLLGIPTSTTKLGDGWQLNLLDGLFATPKRSALSTAKRDGGMAITEEVYEGEVWCVTTQNHNWLARRHGSVYYTGNCFDWGFTNPLAAIEFQVSPDDTVHVWREHYKSYIRLEDHCRMLMERDQPEGYHLDLTFGDCADPGACVTVATLMGVQCLALPESKYGTIKGKRAQTETSGWREGVNLVSSFLKVRDLADTDDLSDAILPEDWDKIEDVKLTKAGLYVDFSCPNTIREFNNYRRDDAGQGTRNPKNPREAAANNDNHALDAIRYGLMHIFKLGARTSALASVYPDLAAQTATSIAMHESGELAYSLSPEEIGLYVPNESTFFPMSGMP